MIRWITVGIGLVCLASALMACSPQDTVSPSPAPTDQTPPPTPANEVLRVSGTSASGARLRLTLPSVKLLKQTTEDHVQLFIVMADPQGTYSYLLYPANRPGDVTERFDLSAQPIELSITGRTTSVVLWMLALGNTRYQAAEMFGIDALVASLGIGFRNWLLRGNPDDDPLAAVVSASEGALFEWFASVEVLGQSLTMFDAEQGWNIPLHSLRSADGGLSVVYTLEYVSAEDVALIPTATPVQERSGYVLSVDETFENGRSAHKWFEGQDSTYINRLVDGAYEITLTSIEQREHGLSWGSMDNTRFQNYVVEAQVRLVEENVVDGRYGLWFHYQDDFNFIYFGISNRGQYRVAVIHSNSNRTEIKDWTTHPAIHTGTTTNTLTIETSPNGAFALSVNGVRLITFADQTFDSGTVAFFCYAESVPTTCRLESLRIWEPAR